MVKDKEEKRVPDHDEEINKPNEDEENEENKPSADEAWKTIAKKDDSKPWSEMTNKEKFLYIGSGTWKVFALLCLLYIFVCSLDLLSTSLQLLGGKATGEIFNNPLLENPVVGLMIGILATVLVQSSSTSTSIVVSLVAAGYFKDGIETVIPIIMGANVGTSVTNTLVAVTRINNRAEFGRAFAGATVHDMFNWLSVITLLIVEVTTGYLFKLTSLIMDSFSFSSTDSEIKLLSVITDPLTNAIIMIDDDVMEGWAIDDPAYENATLLKIYCGDEICPSLFSILQLSDTVSGAIMTVVSLLLLCGCLILLVKLLQNVLQGTMAVVIQKTVNADIPYVPWLTGYLAILVGAAATFLLQSSSVFTSALTPLVGMGIISLSRVYPLTLGSNIGTTTTAMLAALTASADQLSDSIQVALCHLFFNITGILIFYPIPFMRWPLPLAKGLGRITAQYRWFAFAYLISAFLLIPLFVLGLSLADPSGIALIAVGSPIAIVLVLIIIINLLQKKFPKILPSILKTWDWLPLWMRSLEPTDKVLMKVVRSCPCGKKKGETDEEEGGVDNSAYADLEIN